MQDDDYIPLDEAIELVETVLGSSSQQASKSSVINDLVELLDGLRSHLDEIDIELPDPMVLESLKSVIITTSAVRQYAKHSALDLAAINHAAELQLRAERKAGQWLSKHQNQS